MHALFERSGCFTLPMLILWNFRVGMVCYFMVFCDPWIRQWMPDCLSTINGLGSLDKQLCASKL